MDLKVGTRVRLSAYHNGKIAIPAQDATVLTLPGANGMLVVRLDSAGGELRLREVNVKRLSVAADLVL